MSLAVSLFDWRYARTQLFSIKTQKGFALAQHQNGI